MMLNNLQKLSYQLCFALGLANHVRPVLQKKKEPKLNKWNEIEITFKYAMQ